MSTRAQYGLTAAAIVALIAFSLFAWNRRVDTAASEQYAKQLRSLLTLDFRLAADIMKARSGLVSHYDDIVQTSAARKRLFQALRDVPRFVSAQGRAEIDQWLEAGEHAQRESDRLIERWKRENSVLRNSLRFLPVLAAELLPEPRAEDAGYEFAVLAAGLVRDELLLQTWYDGGVIARVDQALTALAARAADVPATDAGRSQLDVLLAHARIVRERTAIVHEQTRALLALDDTARTRELIGSYAREQQIAQRSAEADATLRFALALIALISLAANIILRMRRSAASLRETSAQLRIEQAKQRELSDLKSRFVSMASHEFRTPLSVIMSSSEMLEAYAERWTPEKKAQHFGRIRSAALGMTRMLDGVLMIGRHDAGLLKFEPRPLEINRFCGDVLAEIGDATGHASRIVYRGPAQSEHVVADETLLRHVLENLLSNALKYSSAGSQVELLVGRDRDELCFDVCDRGIGISSHDQVHLFETFHRGTNVGSISGTGLGLAIVRGAAELHGGSVSVQSELGVGTRFTVRIPCARATSPTGCDPGHSESTEKKGQIYEA